VDLFVVVADAGFAEAVAEGFCHGKEYIKYLKKIDWIPADRSQE